MGWRVRRKSSEQPASMWGLKGGTVTGELESSGGGEEIGWFVLDRAHYVCGVSWWSFSTFLLTPKRFDFSHMGHLNLLTRTFLSQAGDCVTPFAVATLVHMACETCFCSPLWDGCGTPWSLASLLITVKTPAPCQRKGFLPSQSSGDKIIFGCPEDFLCFSKCTTSWAPWGVNLLGWGYFLIILVTMGNRHDQSM